ncbi:MAG: VWA domain-containing protein [Gammaproteobacteria bacterium]|jgi:Mg-chelatase subunit ChlD
MSFSKNLKDAPSLSNQQDKSIKIKTKTSLTPIFQIGKSDENLEEGRVLLGFEKLQTSYFEEKIKNNKHYTFVLDISGSMCGSNIENLKKMTKRIVEMTSPEDSVEIITFNSEGKNHLEKISCKKKDTINQSIDELKAGGGTMISNGILQVKKHTTGSNTIILLLTDGESSCYSRHTDAAIQHIKQQFKDDLPLFVGIVIGTRFSLTQLNEYVSISKTPVIKLSYAKQLEPVGKELQKLLRKGVIKPEFWFKVYQGQKLLKEKSFTWHIFDGDKEMSDIFKFPLIDNITLEFGGEIAGCKFKKIQHIKNIKDLKVNHEINSTYAYNKFAKILNQLNEAGSKQEAIDNIKEILKNTTGLHTILKHIMEAKLLLLEKPQLLNEKIKEIDINSIDDGKLPRSTSFSTLYKLKRQCHGGRKLLFRSTSFSTLNELKRQRHGGGRKSFKLNLVSNLTPKPGPSFNECNSRRYDNRKSSEQKRVPTFMQSFHTITFNLSTQKLNTKKSLKIVNRGAIIANSKYNILYENLGIKQVTYKTNFLNIVNNIFLWLNPGSEAILLVRKSVKTTEVTNKIINKLKINEKNINISLLMPKLLKEINSYFVNGEYKVVKIKQQENSNVIPFDKFLKRKAGNHRHKCLLGVNVIRALAEKYKIKLINDVQIYNSTDYNFNNHTMNIIGTTTGDLFIIDYTHKKCFQLLNGNKPDKSNISNAIKFYEGKKLDGILFELFNRDQYRKVLAPFHPKFKNIKKETMENFNSSPQCVADFSVCANEIGFDQNKWECPITNEIIREPVKLLGSPYKGNFEKDAITAWLKNHDTCPMTNMKLKNKKLPEDFSAKKQIWKIMQKTGIPKIIELKRKKKTMMEMIEEFEKKRTIKEESNPKKETKPTAPDNDDIISITEHFIPEEKIKPTVPTFDPTNNKKIEKIKLLILVDKLDKKEDGKLIAQIKDVVNQLEKTGNLSKAGNTQRILCDLLINLLACRKFLKLAQKQNLPELTKVDVDKQIKQLYNKTVDIHIGLRGFIKKYFSVKFFKQNNINEHMISITELTKNKVEKIAIEYKKTKKSNIVFHKK